MSDLMERLKSLHSAEDFFDHLGVPYDPHVLAIARLHILRRMGQYVSAIDAGTGSEGELLNRCREALCTAYMEFTSKAPIETRLFKVLRDRDPERPNAAKRPFVPFSDLLNAKI